MTVAAASVGRRANVPTLVLDAFLVSRTVGAVNAFQRITFRLGVTGCLKRTAAYGQVVFGVTLCVFTTSLGNGARVFAGTRNARGRQWTVGIDSATTRLTTASLVRLSDQTFGADALELARCVAAGGRRMARVALALVDVGAEIVARHLETWCTLAHRFALFNLTQAVETVDQIARVVTFERFPVASVVESAVVVLAAVDTETAQRLVVGVTAGGGRTRTRGLVIDHSANGVGSTRSRSARIATGSGAVAFRYASQWATAIRIDVAFVS